MTRKQQRIYAIVMIVLGVSVALGLSLSALKENVTYFYTPSDVLGGKKLPHEGKPFRLGGLVEKNSVHRDGMTTTFTVTDTKEELNVSYTGIVPDLFREGQGVIATGRLDETISNPTTKVFVATELLAKHDEKYMPPQVAKALKDKAYAP